MEGRVGFEPTTAGSKVWEACAQLAAQRDQAPRAGMGDGETVDQASPDNLPEKQATARGRPLATYVRCDVGCEVERETGIEPV